MGGVAGVACEPPIMASLDPLLLRLPKRPPGLGRAGGGSRRRAEGGGACEVPGAVQERGQV